MDVDAEGRERQPDPAGPDRELQDPATARELGEHADRRVRDAGVPSTIGSGMSSYVLATSSPK